MKSAIALEIVGLAAILAGVMLSSFGFDSKAEHTAMQVTSFAVFLFGCALGFIGARRCKRLRG